MGLSPIRLGPVFTGWGILVGVNNTITTQVVMTVSPVEKPVASAAYSFVRFIGGGLAPYAAGRMVLVTPRGLAGRGRGGPRPEGPRRGSPALAAR